MDKITELKEQQIIDNILKNQKVESCTIKYEKEGYIMDAFWISKKQQKELSKYKI
jgi:hypothetical protein